MSAAKLAHLPTWWRAPSGRHFGAPLSLDAVLNIVATPEGVSHHAFWPLLRRIKAIRRFDYKTGAVIRKERALLIAAPGDVNLLSYYRQLLSARYEARIAELGLDQVITAYRSARPGSNVEFALEAFAWMRAAAPCSVSCFDVAGFFDALDHSHLKQAWRDLLGEPRLPADHFAIYKALTRYAWVDASQLPEALCQIPQPRTFCTASEFRRLRKTGKLDIQRHTRTMGIPQGLSISNVLSNLYMLTFDQAIQAEVNARKGFYRRYCDDIFIVLPQAHADDEAIENLVRAQLKALSLPLNENKTSHHRLRPDRAGHACLAQPPVQYLGLVDDGRQVLLRGATIGRFHRRMKASVRRATRQAKERGRHIPKGLLRRRFAMPGPRNFFAYSQRIENALKRANFSRPLSVRHQLRRSGKQLALLFEEND